LRCECVETAFQIACVERRARQQKPILVPALALDHGQALAREAGNRHRHMRYALLMQQTAKHLAGQAANRKDRERLATEPMYRARHIDAAAARIVTRFAAAQLVPGHHRLRRRCDVERRVHCECYDWSHPKPRCFQLVPEICISRLFSSSLHISALMYLSRCGISPADHPTDLDQGFSGVLVPVWLEDVYGSTRDTQGWPVPYDVQERGEERRAERRKRKTRDPLSD